MEWSTVEWRERDSNFWFTSPGSYKSWGWPGLQSETGNSVHISHTCGKDPKSLSCRLLCRKRDLELSRLKPRPLCEHPKQWLNCQAKCQLITRRRPPFCRCRESMQSFRGDVSHSVPQWHKFGKGSCIPLQRVFSFRCWEADVGMTSRECGMGTCD